ncbi:putative bacteriophage CI repressor helix-turn-helix domain protein [Desulfovibrionales bacterium]
MFDEVFDRIKLAIGTRTQVELAEALDIRQSSISDAKRRNSIPSEWYIKLFKKYGLNPDWLEAGIGPWYLKNEDGDYVATIGPMQDSMRAIDEADISLDNKGTVVTVYSMHCDVENGTWNPRPSGKINIPQSYVLPSIKVLRMAGTSMNPIIHKNAFVGVDTDKKDIISGELYAVYVPNEGLTIKRVFLDVDSGRYVLRCENKNYPEHYLSVSRQNERTLGCTVWVLQKI